MGLHSVNLWWVEPASKRSSYLSQLWKTLAPPPCQVCPEFSFLSGIWGCTLAPGTRSSEQLVWKAWWKPLLVRRRIPHQCQGQQTKAPAKCEVWGSPVVPHPEGSLGIIDGKGFQATCGKKCVCGLLLFPKRCLHNPPKPKDRHWHPEGSRGRHLGKLNRIPLTVSPDFSEPWQTARRATRLKSATDSLRDSWGTH